MLAAGCSSDSSSGIEQTASAEDIIKEYVPESLQEDISAENVKAISVNRSLVNVHVFYEDGSMASAVFTEKYNEADSYQYEIGEEDGKKSLSIILDSSTTKYMLTAEELYVRDSSLTSSEFEYMAAVSGCDINGTSDQTASSDLSGAWFIMEKADRPGSYEFVSADQVYFESSDNDEKAVLKYTYQNSHLTIYNSDGDIYVDCLIDGNRYDHYDYYTVVYGSLNN